MNSILTTSRVDPGPSRHLPPITQKETQTSMGGDAKETCFPFGYSRDDYLTELRHRDTLDLVREIEASQWIALEHANESDGTREYVECQLSAMVDELERRQRLLNARRDDPLRPQWPKTDAAFSTRIDAVKAAWPIERFCRDLLACDLISAGPDRWKARCPLPGHTDRTPSFTITVSKDLAWCFGCNRGGDVIKLSQYVLNTVRFIDALRLLEREGGVG